MRQCQIDFALVALNAARRLTYPQVGYVYYADIKGDGVKRPRKVWTIINEGGGVTRSDLNGKHTRETLARIRAALRGV